MYILHKFVQWFLNVREKVKTVANTKKFVSQAQQVPIYPIRPKSAQTKRKLPPKLSNPQPAKQQPKPKRKVAKQVTPVKKAIKKSTPAKPRTGHKSKAVGH